MKKRSLKEDSTPKISYKKLSAKFEASKKEEIIFGGVLDTYDLLIPLNKLHLFNIKYVKESGNLVYSDKNIQDCIYTLKEAEVKKGSVKLSAILNGVFQSGRFAGRKDIRDGLKGLISGQPA